MSAFVLLGERLAAKVEKEMVIQTAYLIPTSESIDGIRKLTERGIHVRVMTNTLQSNNHISVHAHYMKYRKALIDAGAELHELRAEANDFARGGGLPAADLTECLRIACTGEGRAIDVGVSSSHHNWVGRGFHVT